MKCPVGKKECPCEEYSKDELCDYPYRNGMSLEEIQEITKARKND